MVEDNCNVEVRCTNCGKLFGKANKTYEAISNNVKPSFIIKCDRCKSYCRYKEK